MDPFTSQLSPNDQVLHPQHGAGAVVYCNGPQCTVDFTTAGRKIVHVSALDRPGARQEGEAISEEDGPNISELEKKLFKKPTGTHVSDAPVSMAPKWRGGRMMLHPGNSDLKAKEVPVDSFFRKIVLVRERLRRMEQVINNHPKLDDLDRLDLQQYLTRIYGSLTTFNVLFADREDHFTGEKKE